MIITRPVKSSRVNQKFGENLNDFYSELGLLGHNGIDWGARSGEELRFNADSRGKVIQADDHPTYGKRVVVATNDGVFFYKHYYGHLKEYCVKVGDYVDTGDLLGHTDNTGKYTTGPHLHYGLYECNKNAITIDTDNGYGGAIDHSPYYKDVYVLDYISNLQGQVSILRKLVELWIKLKNIKNK